MSLLLRRHAMLSEATAVVGPVPIFRFTFDDGPLSPDDPPVQTGSTDVSPITTSSTYGAAQALIGNYDRTAAVADPVIGQIGIAAESQAVDVIKVHYIDQQGNDNSSALRDIALWSEILYSSHLSRYTVDGAFDVPESNYIQFTVFIAEDGGTTYTGLSDRPFMAFQTAASPTARSIVAGAVALANSPISLPLNCTVVADLRVRDDLITSGATVIDTRIATGNRSGYRFQVLGPPAWYIQMILGDTADNQHIQQFTPADRTVDPIIRLVMRITNGSNIEYLVDEGKTGTLTSLDSRPITVPYTVPLPTKDPWTLGAGDDTALEYHLYTVYDQALSNAQIEAIP